MTEPDLDREGWALEDGETYHREAPDTFHIPDLAVRRVLKPGDLAKLIFRIAVIDDDAPEAVERMWVIVLECTSSGYIGVLDNEPSSIEVNPIFWRGTLVPFDYRHIIAVEHGNDESRALVA